MCQICKGKGFVREVISANNRKCEAGNKYGGLPEFRGQQEPSHISGRNVVDFPRK